MATMIRIKKGLDIPVSGTPVQEISQGAAIRRVAIVAADYVGLRPAMAVRDGDRVRLGQTLLTDKSSPQIRFTAPAAGTIRAVNRGAKRKLISIEIDLDGDEEERFATYGTSSLTPEQARENLTAVRALDGLANSSVQSSSGSGQCRPFDFCDRHGHQSTGGRPGGGSGRAGRGLCVGLARSDSADRGNRLRLP